MRIVGAVSGRDGLWTVQTEGGLVSGMEPTSDRAPLGDDVMGGPDVIVAPALLDMQVNGFQGHDFNGTDASGEEAAALVNALHEAGVGLCCPTVVTASGEHMAGCLRAIAAACEAPQVAAAVAGVHLEGPYISPEDGPRGAHPLAHVRAPDWQEFQRLQDAAGGRIRVVTLAPEVPGAIEFIERLAEAGVVVAIGHSGAETPEIEEAVKAGARLSTHLGNAAHAVLPRHPNYIWDQLADDRLWASVIPDGHHLPPTVLRSFIRCKGIEQTVFVSDAIRVAGLPAGDYEFAGHEVELTAAGRVQLVGTPYLAGSALALAQGVANAVRLAGVSLADALRMATVNPAILLGIDDRYGTVEVGKEATLTLLHWDEEAQQIEVRATLLRGEVVHRLTGQGALQQA